MPHIHHELLIAATPEKVYHALTTAEGLSAWWTPGATAVPGQGSIARFPFGEGYYKEMEVVALEPATRVQWHCIAGAHEWIGTDINFRLMAVDKRSIQLSHPEINGQAEQLASDNATLLIFHHDNWKEYTPMFAECSYTWALFLRSLKLYCETGVGTPWPQQHGGG